MTHTKDEALKLAAKFDKRFTSMNGIDVPERVSVPRDEWRALHDAIKQALAAPVQEPFGYVYEVYCLPECACEMEWVESFDRYEPDAAENIRNVTPVYTTPPAQPAPSQYGSPELQAMVVARAIEKDRAAQPAPVPLTDELSHAVRMACQLSFKDHGRRSVNEQAWQRLMQAVAAFAHGITAAPEKGN